MNPHIRALYREARRYAKARVRNKAVLSVIVIVAVWNVAVSFDWFIEHFPIPLETQLRFYQWMWSFRSSSEFDKSVVLVKIDDDLHWAHSFCDSPTSRHLLAQLVGNASKPATKASVIAIDVKLYAPKGKPAGWDNHGREEEDAELLTAIQDAAKIGVTVVFPIGLVQGEAGEWTRIPSIYRDQDLPLADSKTGCGYPACAVLGWITLPADKRELPLRHDAADWYKNAPVSSVPSLALAAANARSKQSTLEHSNPELRKAITNSTPLLGKFLPEASFDSVRAKDLADGNDIAIQKCAGSIVLIGGEWHSDEGYGEFEDLHLSPVGAVPGMVLHASYIEALLGASFARAVPLFWAILIDLAIGFALYLGYDLAHGWWKLAVLLLGTLPFVAAYFAFVNFNRYLDFVFPTVLFLVHLIYEQLEHLVRTARHARRRHA